MYQKVLKIAKLKFCDILDLKFAIHSKKDLTNRINCHSLFLTNMYKLFLEKHFSNLKECKYFYKWNIVSYQKKIFRRQFRWIPVEMLCPILDKNLPVENEISLISFKIFDINIWSQCKKKNIFLLLDTLPQDQLWTADDGRRTPGFDVSLFDCNLTCRSQDIRQPGQLCDIFLDWEPLSVGRLHSSAKQHSIFLKLYNVPLGKFTSFLKKWSWCQVLINIEKVGELYCLSFLHLSGFLEN